MEGIAIVTGGSRGIGRAASVALRSLGLSVVNLCTSIDRNPSTPFIAQFECDVSNYSNVKECVHTISERFNGIRVLVNNAGVQQKAADSDALDVEEWERVLKINLSGVYLMTRQIIPLMKMNGGGSIINIGSVAADLGYPRAVAYAVAKAGVHGMTISLAKELATYDIRVNTIAPGLTLTDAGLALSEQARCAIVKQIPVGRAASPNDITGAVQFLASDASSYITGTVLRVAGGR